MIKLYIIRNYTGKELETDRLNNCPKNRSPVEPPGTSANIIKSNVITCITANSTVNAVLCAHIAK